MLSFISYFFCVYKKTLCFSFFKAVTYTDGISDATPSLEYIQLCGTVSLFLCSQIKLQLCNFF
jgi:hypothetical protein